MCRTPPAPPPRRPQPAPATPSRAPVVLEGERKRATVLHSGIANASDVAERLGSVEMHQLIDRLLLMAQEEVARYDGVMTEKHADGFVAVFGAREVHEDDARRAILTALGIGRRIGDLASVAGVRRRRPRVEDRYHDRDRW